MKRTKLNTGLFLICLVLIIIAIFSISAFGLIGSVMQFFNGLTQTESLNLTYTTNQNNTLWIDILKSADTTAFTANITGFNGTIASSTADIDANLVLWLPFNESVDINNAYTDHSGYNNNFTERQNGTTAIVPNCHSYIENDGCLQLIVGASRGLIHNDNNLNELDFSGSFSICMWLNNTFDAGIPEYGIIGNDNEGGSRNWAWTGSDTTMNFRVWNQGLGTVQTDFNSTAGKWSHLCMVYTNITDTTSTYEYYINGVRTLNISNARAPPRVDPADTQTIIGGKNSLGKVPLAQMDEIRAYNISLTPAQVQSVFNLYTAYPKNPYVEVGTPDDTREFSYEDHYNITTNADLNATLMSLILYDCDCLGCSTPTAGVCRVPLLASSDTPGVLGFSGLDLQYFNNSKLNLSIFYENNGSQIIGKTINILSKSDNNEVQNSTSTGFISIDNLDPGEYTVTLIGDGFSSRTYTVTPLDKHAVLLNAYLSGNTTEVTFTVKDKDTSELLEGVLGTMYRVINNSWLAIESKESDISGRLVFNYMENTKYRFILTRSGYNEFIFVLDPVLFEEYDILMEPSFLVNKTHDYDRITLIWDPKLFYNDQQNNFTFLISSPFGELQSYQYNLTYPGGSTGNAGTNSQGEQLTSSFTITGAGPLDVLRLDFSYETEISGSRNFTYNYPIALEVDNGTMIQLRDETYGLGLFERLLIAVLGALFITGIATLIGRPVPGLFMGLAFMGILTYMKFIPLWSILISFTVALILVGSQIEV